jgi:hypothetical protein
MNRLLLMYHFTSYCSRVKPVAVVLNIFSIFLYWLSESTDQITINQTTFFIFYEHDNHYIEILT